jgi:hypothetical protein
MTSCQYSSAAAPDANILLVSCDAGFPGGIIAALTGTLALPNPPGVISISYGECEAQLGPAANATFNNLYLTAALMGISVFVSSGDALGYKCDGNGASLPRALGPFRRSAAQLGPEVLQMIVSGFALLRHIVLRPAPNRCAYATKVMKRREQVLIHRLELN